jgi:hypothetical protein
MPNGSIPVGVATDNRLKLLQNVVRKKREPCWDECGIVAVVGRTAASPWSSRSASRRAKRALLHCVRLDRGVRHRSGEIAALERLENVTKRAGDHRAKVDVEGSNSRSRKS